MLSGPFVFRGKSKNTWRGIGLLVASGSESEPPCELHHCEYSEPAATCFSVAVPVLPPQGFHQRITYSNLPGPVRRAVQQHQCSGGIDFGRGSGHGANQRGETDGGLARLSGAACFWGSSPVAGDCGRELCGGESALFRPPCQTGFVRHPAGAYGGSG